MSQVEHGYSHTYTPPGWLPVRASEDWRQISVKPAAAATPAAVVLMQQNYKEEEKKTVL